MLKKILSLSLAAILVAASLCACQDPTDDTVVSFGFEGTKELAAAGVVSTTADQITVTGDPTAIKIGAVLVGDENEGYTLAHIQGIQAAAAQLGIDESQILWKYSIAEDQTCFDACKDLVEQGCNAVFTNSYGHQDHTLRAAKEYPNVAFVAVTGDTAAANNLSNFSNAFNDVYESRYVSGVVAGLKLKELVDSGELTKEKHADAFDANGNIKIGYVGAFPYAEVVSGYTAFYLGIKSVLSNVAMEVQYTNSWFNLTAEGTTAQSLMAKGCVIIGQHADSTGAPSACQAAHDEGKLVYSVGYNIDMRNVAPDVALTSATNNWAVYYAYAFANVINGTPIATNWSAGYKGNAVAITDLGTACAEGTAEKVAEVIDALKNGTLHVFDTSKFTIEGKQITWAYGTDSDGDFAYDCNNVVADGYYHESFVQSAPSLSLRIDGITEA